MNKYALNDNQYKKFKVLYNLMKVLVHESWNMFQRSRQKHKIYEIKYKLIHVHKH